MRVKNMNLIVFIISVTFFVFEGISSSTKFGKFEIKSLTAMKCKGPKRVDCCKVDFYIDDGKIIHCHLNATENIAPLKAKIIVTTTGKGLRLQVNKICEHIFMKPFMKSIVNLTEDCGVQKGNYTFSIDMDYIVQQYYGGEFFFGNFSVLAILSNNQCNFSCTMLTAVLVPKHEH